MPAWVLAGLFAGLVLAKAGFKPIVLERGCDVESRARAVEEFRSTGRLNPNANVQFGEGGAGAFSDGKLTTGIKDPRCRTVLEVFQNAGAPEEILYLSKPHIGTDILPKVVKNIREAIIKYGGEIRFNTRLDGLVIKGDKLCAVKTVSVDGVRNEIDTDSLITAVGHSARDTFEMLYDAKRQNAAKAVCGRRAN